MRIGITFFTIVKQYAGMQGMEVELGTDATVGELLREVGRRLEHKLPVWIWDPENQVFHPAVNAYVDGELVRHLTCPLHDGSQVFLVGGIAGG
jgi:hypothetical protein